MQPRTAGRAWTKCLVFAVLVTAVVVGYMQFGEAITLDHLAAREAELKAFQRDHPWLVYGLAFAIYVSVTGLSLPGAVVLTLSCGWFFGLGRGVLLVSFASTTGATVAFLISRYLLREPLRNRFGERLVKFNQALEREGAFYLFMLRLIPAAPFFVINVVMGLTPLRARTFWWVSQIGMLPGTAVYVYAGSSVPDLATLAEQGGGGILSPQLLVAFILLGVPPLLLRQLLSWIRPSSAADLTGDPHNADGTIPVPNPSDSESNTSPPPTRHEAAS